jgi:hypothetical protein
MTEQEFLRAAGIKKVRYWRAKKAKISEDARIVVLREAEAALDRLEAERSKAA